MTSAPASSARLALAAIASVAISVIPALAQTHNATRAPVRQAPAASQTPASQAEPVSSEPDFALANLPTSLAPLRNKLAFRLTTRFSRPLGNGDAGDLAADLFGIDSLPRIGLELRYGLLTDGQVGIYRTSNRTIELFGQYQFVHQRALPFAVSARFSVEGKDNFSERFSPAIQLVIGREIGDRVALYFEPGFIRNVNDGDVRSRETNTGIIGIGGRARILKSIFTFVEASPRISGYAPGDDLISFGIEKRAGANLLQVSFSNSLGTTAAQVARGTLIKSDDWFIGVTLSHKFY